MAQHARDITEVNLLPMEDAFDGSTIQTLQQITSIQYPDDRDNISLLQKKCKAIKINS